MLNLKYMRRKKRPFWLLVISLLTFTGLFYLILKFDPSQKYLILNNQYPIPLLFFILIFILAFSFSTYLSNNSRRGLFIALFLTSYLLLRFFHLTQTYFIILLIILFLTIEVFFIRQR
ncbi:MAG: hypothetical protein HYT07_00630 [Candidatus Levybacteria bacterium]|nr:hypothetical protein [Candidatus Levybacteria bacterium]